MEYLISGILSLDMALIYSQTLFRLWGSTLCDVADKLVGTLFSFSSLNHEQIISFCS